MAGFGPGVRTWGREANSAFADAAIASVERERAELARLGASPVLPRADYLAISGGGQNGAFGAGLLCAWSDRGDRPRFKVVTGISTGALTAPFVFAGPQYDHVLREVYTKTKTDQIMTMRGLIAGIFQDAMADTAPLWKMISKYVDDKLLAAIAEEHRKGRLLIIGTTNLDARRAVLWNVGEIAASGKPGSLDLVRKILIASASIPGAFPPVLIDVELDGTAYQEMHVDGGVMTQVFVYPPTTRLREVAGAAGIERERRAYIIRNSRLDADAGEVERSTMTIVGRSIDSLITMQGVGDLYRIHSNCVRDGVDFNLAFIPSSFNIKPTESFDPVYMTRLFQVGYDAMRGGDGYPWEKHPPGYDGVPASMLPVAPPEPAAP